MVLKTCLMLDCLSIFFGDKIKNLSSILNFLIFSSTESIESFFTSEFETGENVLPTLAYNSFK